MQRRAISFRATTAVPSMSTWRQKREMEDLKARDPVAYERLVSSGCAFSVLGLRGTVLDDDNHVRFI